MHEFHIVEGIVKQILEKAKNSGAKKVTKVVLVMGSASGFDESSVRLYFNEIIHGSIIDGAVLIVNALASKLRCNTCDMVFDKKIGEFNCPKCGNLGVKPSSGAEFYIDYIEIDS